MSKVCEKCQRGTVSGQTKSHSNIKTKRVVMINLQSKIVDGVRQKLCTRCIKTLAKKSK
ncbi:MAG: 50S ribosomal protein L28 [Candidatus Komeilibacteria bacterium CG_4_10_14_0_2_um_filter_37_10]|uniref:50S ribosomal protein L28 n=1 Tax=Candidatus Komeilibacteria bacterium CG_4_10_14_0_2_um_filter_37_10 TaxID=1974470 RepID=A0A2M7VEG2_9BACT|nr:MAG: 50S ribosomal protein L28 [Candidatus Komeilibacteria bacterium CG_4_10_14_0_2_um_filter_37_10]PJA92594.1 MAG: 50S ribosomal protein L28 [Candidatus Komeilibacteria bacterium CG_4_9_14_3_um_filter_37_5]